ncbi:unnamed protein product, partial [Coccothraustes coccothraustes]
MPQEIRAQGPLASERRSAGRNELITAVYNNTPESSVQTSGAPVSGIYLCGAGCPGSCHHPAGGEGQHCLSLLPIASAGRPSAPSPLRGSAGRGVPPARSRPPGKPGSAARRTCPAERGAGRGGGPGAPAAAGAAPGSTPALPPAAPRSRSPAASDRAPEHERAEREAWRGKTGRKKWENKWSRMGPYHDRSRTTASARDGWILETSRGSSSCASSSISL